MKDIKYFIKSIITFIPFVVLMYLTLILLGNRLSFSFLKPNINYVIGSNGHLYSRINEIKYYEDVDVLFLGSSHSYRGFDTRIFKDHDIYSFNLGSSNQTPIQTEVLLKRHLNCINPKMIIFEVSPIVFSNDGVESSLDLISNDKNDFLTITHLIKWDNIKTINTAIVGFYNNFSGDDEIIEHKIKGDDLYITGGYVEKSMKSYKSKEIKMENLGININQITALERCINIINKYKIKLILVQAPIKKSLNSSYSNQDKFDNKMLEYGEYYNFNNLLDLSDSIHFFDSNHLNQNGVIIFNEQLIELLKL